MRIKVFVFFVFSFIGTSIDSSGQRLVSHRGHSIQKIDADTMILSLEEKIKILDEKCERVWVRQGYDEDMEACYTYRLEVVDTLEDGTLVRSGEFQASKVKDWVFIKSKSSDEAKYIIQPMAYGSTEERLTTIWKRDNEGYFKIMKSWWGEMKEFTFQKEKLSLTVLQYGCCANDFICEEVYEYKNKRFERQSQICFLNKMKLVSNRKSDEFMTTADSTYLFVHTDSLRSKNITRYRDATPKERCFGELKEGAYALIKPNQEGKVFAEEKIENIFWYFVVFAPDAIQRRMSDGWTGYEKYEIHLAGWMKSEVPLEIRKK